MVPLLEAADPDLPKVAASKEKPVGSGKEREVFTRAGSGYQVYCTGLRKSLYIVKPVSLL